ncbi:MAG: sugar phosphate isomerase/epimerase [Pyrinomonadaceae bacterium]|nr:sugar phosphate isomerase/epimerase [Phycisphaerales bacterium]
MHRRDFLAISAAAGAAASLVPGAVTPGMVGLSSVFQQPTAAPKAAPTFTSKRTLKKAVMYGMIGEGKTVLERFTLLRDCGFQGVEMDSPSKTPADEILAAAEKTGIQVHGLVDSVHWQFHLNCPEAEIRTKGVQALETALRDGKKFGASSVLLVPALVNGQQPYDHAWELSIAEIRKVLPLAKELGVMIAIENVWNNFLLSPLEAARYVDELNGPAGAPGAGMAAFHFDIGNVINYGWPEQWVRILGRRIVKLHIKDFSRKKRDEQGLWKGFDVELGEGDAGWAPTMKALDDIGYSTAPEGNWATAEVGGGKADRLKQISEQMDKLFAL